MGRAAGWGVLALPLRAAGTGPAGGMGGTAGESGGVFIPGKQEMLYERRAQSVTRATKEMAFVCD